mgnify:CR=1 FL=1
MILQTISEEELTRIIAANTPYIPEIEERTGIQRKTLMEALVVSDYLLHQVAETSDEAKLTLDAFIDSHCSRVAEETGLSAHDVKNIFIMRTEVMLNSL